MAFVYRYIEMKDNDMLDVVYIGKVTRYREEPIDALMARHKEHKRDLWYKNGNENIVLEYIQVPSNADADILESWYIAKSNPAKLHNVAKMWGQTNISIKCEHEPWKTLKHKLEDDYIKASRALTGMVLDKYDKSDTQQYDAKLIAEQIRDEFLDILTELDKIKRFEKILKGNVEFYKNYAYML